MKDLENSIQQILERNHRVEQDKKWEISLLRRSVITIVTFILAFLFLTIINAENSFLGALVPTGGYILSQLPLTSLRKFWEKKQT